MTDFFESTIHELTMCSHLFLLSLMRQSPEFLMKGCFSATTGETIHRACSLQKVKKAAEYFKCIKEQDPIIQQKNSLFVRDSISVEHQASS